ncbi:hypothetical protein BpHYR1_029996, partial [Brachionus plicatilis]
MNGNQIFKINQTFNECGMKLYGFTEADFGTIHDLILTDSDGIELKIYTALDRFKEEICNIELSSLRTFRHHEDQFEILYAGNKTLIVYVRDGIIFVPNCKTSYSVEVENYDGCTRDPKVSFELSGKRNTGYISKSNIIRYDNEEQCKAKRYDIKKLTKRKYKLHLMMRSRNGCLVLKDEYKSTCKELKILVKLTRMSFEKKTALECKNNPKVIYSYIYNQRKSKDRIRSLANQNGDLIVDKETIANLLGDQFQKTF